MNPAATKARAGQRDACMGGSGGEGEEGEMPLSHFAREADRRLCCRAAGLWLSPAILPALMRRFGGRGQHLSEHYAVMRAWIALSQTRG